MTTQLPRNRRFAAAGLRSMLLISFLLLPATAQAQWFPDSADVRVMLRYLVEDQETPGIVLGWIDADGTPRIASYGSSGPDSPPLTAESVFEVGSITKVFTAVLLADAVSRGEVSLDDPVSKHLGVRVPSRNGREITLLDIATHRSSLPRMADDMGSSPANPYPQYSMQQLLDFIARHELRRDIGSEYEYSNIAVALLGEALARAAGKPYQELLRERVLEPLGMTSTGFSMDEFPRQRTQGHGPGGVMPYRGWTELPAMGAMRTTAGDLLEFLAANLREPRTHLDSVMRMTWSEGRGPVSAGVEIGLLWNIRTFGDRQIVLHGGSTAGYDAQIAFEPARGTAVVRLANVQPFEDDIEIDVLRRGRPLDVAEVDVPRNVLARYEGTYGRGNSRAYVRLEDDGWLTFQASPNVRFRMYAESDSSFVVKRTPWRFTFLSDANGNVTRIAADLEGQAGELPKLDEPVPSPAVAAHNAILEVPLAEADMAPYVGTYAVSVGAQTLTVRVYIENGQLIGHPQGTSPERLVYQGDHTFVPGQDPGNRVIFTVVNGRADRVEIRDGNQSFTGTRVEGT